MLVADAITLDIQVSGGPTLEAAVQNAFSKFRPELEGVLFEEGSEIMATSKQIVPHDLGTLQASGGFYGTVSNAEGVYVRIGYGGAASAYAKIQHETPPHIFSHDEGRSWKYLQIPVFEAIETMPGRIASRLAARLTAAFSGGGGGGSGATFGGG